MRCFSNREKWFWHKEGSQDYLNKQMNNSTPQVYIEHILTVFVSLLIFMHISLPSGYSLVQLLSRVRLFVTPWTAAHPASLSITNSWSSFKLLSIKSEMPSNQLILCHPLLLLPSIFPSIRVFSSESAFRIRWPKYLSP